MTDTREQAIETLLVGESRAIREIRREILRFAPTKLPILIEGPTGSGKELVARAIHGASRRDGSLVAFNVCALGDGMFEDALFGHVRGAFTGAAGDAVGYLGEANGGSVFLDEISGLSIQSQAKLLRALETGVFRPIGASRDRLSDFRLLSASNENLRTMARERRFRVDLLHRVGGCILTLPSLSERREDIPILIRHFLSAGHAISNQAIERLQSHEWPGNVRELRHAVDRLVVVAEGSDIALAHVNVVTRASGQAGHALEPDLLFRASLIDILEEADWNTAVVACRLKVHRATVYRWMSRLRIAGPQARTDIKLSAAGVRGSAVLDLGRVNT